ncbi:hypothetical protein GCM10022224_023850 [Nonomuraea antimicrobica]|uniref:Golgi phosphoprotein 3 (GPP34) n=1 Tax=Nonomuraea antimicrobica TaxID=561173 RepID=A0ABP7BG28_9ACTN
MNGREATLWRDYHRDAIAVTGMSLGTRQLRGHPSACALELFRQGCRKVTFDDVVDVESGTDEVAAVRSLALVRELTALGIVTEWRLRLGGDVSWQVMSHLYPPLEIVSGETEALRHWRNAYVTGRLIWRRGPGFLLVRDCRWGGMRRFTITQSDYLRVIEALNEGDAAANAPARVLATLAARHLAVRVGSMYCWLPYRVRRWPDNR